MLLTVLPIQDLKSLLDHKVIAGHIEEAAFPLISTPVILNGWVATQKCFFVLSYCDIMIYHLRFKPHNIFIHQISESENLGHGLSLRGDGGASWSQTSWEQLDLEAKFNLYIQNLVRSVLPVLATSKNAYSQLRTPVNLMCM